MKQKGFTLIELLVVMVIVAVLGTSGFAMYNNYNQSQIVQTSAVGVQTMLNLARSRAQSQIKPQSPVCDGTLEGYGVEIVNPNIYRLYVACSSSGNKIIAKQDKTLPSGLSIGSSQPNYFFPVMTGGVSSSGCIEIDGGLIRWVKVESTGDVSVQTSCP